MTPDTAVDDGDLRRIDVDGLWFRDLDHDGTLAPYEDWRLPALVRARDLLSRMTLTEKVGAMLHGTAPARGPLGQIGVGDRYDLVGVRSLVHDRAITSMITRLAVPPAEFAAENNALQRIAAQGRLGIPVTVSSDPRHHFTTVLGASNDSTGFSQWPETLGLAAIGDADVVREFADTIRREYRAVGLHQYLGPQADLATSPRWPRADGTFGEDPILVRRLVGAFVEGVQGGRDGVGPTSVAAVVKHWAGYGASRDGFDGHNWYGRFSAFPSGAFGDHVDAFLDAFDAGVAGVMPTYNILQGLTLDGVPVEEVGAGFNAQLVEGLLRGRHGFDGVVLSDWAITRDLTAPARTGSPAQTPDQIAMPWGVEDLTRPQRFARCINAGVDQIGGEDDPQPLLEAIGAGLVPVERIDQAVVRILVDKFRLGLFEKPLVDVTATSSVGAAPARAAAATAQRRSLTWVCAATSASLPLPAGARVLVEGIDSGAAQRHGLVVVDDPAAADAAVVRVQAPSQSLHPGHFFGSRQHEGDLDFNDSQPQTRRLLELCRTVPTVVVVHLDRPCVLGEVADRAAAVLASYGADDDAVIDVLTGTSTADGRLPFRLHATMDDALAQPCDRPSPDIPGRFPIGHRATPSERR